MFDSLFNLIIVMIPLAIFIGRALVLARRRYSPPKTEAKKTGVPPDIGKAFFIEEDDIPHWERAKKNELIKEIRNKRKTSSWPDELPIRYQEVIKPALSASAAIDPPVTEKKETAASSFNLARLSALQQAVVMAEILGPPAALR